MIPEFNFEQILLCITFLIFVYYYFLKKHVEDHNFSNHFISDPLTSINLKKIRRKSSTIDIDRTNIFRKSYTDLRRGFDFYQFPLSQKSFNRLPEDIVFLIENVKVFGHFEKNILLNLFNYMETKSFLAGELLNEPCDYEKNIMVVQSGLIDVYVINEKNHWHKIKQAKKGDSIYSLLNILEKFNKFSSSHPHSLSMVAVEDSVLLSIPIDGLQEVLQKHPDALIDVVRLIGLRLQRVTLSSLKNYFGISLFLLFKSDLKIDNNKNKYKICFSDSSDSDIVPIESPEYKRCLSCKSKNLFKSRGKCLECKTFQAINYMKKTLSIPENLLLDSHFKPHMSKRGDIICKQGEIFKELHLLIDGEVDLLEDSSSESIKLSASNFMGTLSILTGESSLFTYKTSSEKAHYVSISRVDLFHAVENHPITIIKLATCLLQKLNPFLRQVDFGIDWKYLEAGKLLYKQADPSDSAFVVLSGRLQSSEDKNSRSMLTGEYGKGEIVGLAETLTQSLRGSHVVAVRDTELACLSNELISFIKSCYPDSITRLVQLLGQKILNSLNNDANLFSMISVSHKEEFSSVGRISTVAIVSLSPGINISVFTNTLNQAISLICSVETLTSEKVLKLISMSSFDAAPHYFLSNWLAHREDQHDMIIYKCDPFFNFWSQKCVRQADCILLVASINESKSVRKIEQQITTMPSRARKYLILLHPLHAERPQNTVDWLRIRPWCSGHFHIRCNSSIFFPNSDSSKILTTSDFKRLARTLTNKAVGVVLGGGAARGCAHVGVIKAMLEEDLPIDMIAGTSIGSMVGAVWATYTDFEKFYKVVEQLCKTRLNRLFLLALDFTFPLTSFFTGNYFNRSIRDTIGPSICIEDLWIPYFCLSTDITISQQRVHTFGSLWRYVRASMSLAGYMPPLCDPVDGHLLLDGVYTNNLPADVMFKEMIGTEKIFAIDVGRVSDENFSNYGESLSGWWVFFSRLLPWVTSVKVPNIFEIQSKVGYVLCEKQLEEVKNAPYCKYLRPPIDQYGSLQFAKFDEIYSVGYDFGKKYFKNLKQTL